MKGKSKEKRKWKGFWNSLNRNLWNRRKIWHHRLYFYMFRYIFIYDVIKKMQNGKTEHSILCMNEDDVNISFKPDTPSDQNRLVCESLKSKTAELSTLFLCCWKDPCWLYIRWTIFILVWIVWLASWMIRTWNSSDKVLQYANL